MKSFLLFLLFSIPAMAGPPVTWSSSCGSGIFNLAQNSCLATGGGSVTAVTASTPLASSGGVTPNLTCQVASGTQAGCLASADWTTFNSKQAALTIGNLTDVGTDGITVTGGTGAVIGTGTSIDQHVADTTHNGYLLSTDWTTFNGKQPAGSYITALTGDVTASGPGSSAATLINSVNVVYVDFISGNDTTGTGSPVRPWKTLQKAYNSITPSINVPYTIHISGGNNDTDTAITAKPNVSLFADYSIQISPSFTISGGTTNDGATFTNINFVGAFSWIRNDGTNIGVTFNNCQFFAGPVLKQSGAGVASVFGLNSTFVNSEFQLAHGGYGVFPGTNFLGTTTFDDPGTGGTYYEFIGGYNSGAMSISGAVDPAYFAGFVQDTAFGATLTFVTTGSGTPIVESDSAGLTPTYTGTPTKTFLSLSQYINFIKGAQIGTANGAPSATNVLLEVKDGHTKSSQTTAPTATVNANAGTGATCTVSNATDNAGTINLTTTATTPAAGDQCDINFNKTYNVAPICVVTPANNNAALFSVANGDFFTTTTGTLVVNYANADATGHGNVWSYYCTETQ